MKKKHKLTRVSLWLAISFVLLLISGQIHPRTASASISSSYQFSTLRLPINLFPSMEFYEMYLNPTWFSYFTPLAPKSAANKTALASASTQTLKPESSTPVLKFAVISDIHVESSNKQSHTKLKQALGDLNKTVPDSQALVVNGDLGNGLPEDYAVLTKLMNILPHPQNVFYTMGNHDYYKSWVDSKGNWSVATFPNGETEQASQARFLQFAGRDKLYADNWLKGYHFIFLGSEQFQQSDPANGEDAWLSDTQLAWLEQRLKEKEEPQQPIFIFLHQPLTHTVAGSDSIRGVVQYARLEEILSHHRQVIFFTSHTHWELESNHTLVKDKFTMVNTSSVYEPYDQTDHAYSQDLNMSEGLTVEVYPNRVIIRGRDFTQGKWIPTAQFSLPLEPNPAAAAQ